MKIGDYVRTRWGYICKIININEFREPSMRYSVEASYLKDIVFIGDEEIIKSSPNIIDLIEVGDYVNGCKVTTGNQGVGSIYIAEIDGLGLKKKLYEKDIKSIVTKEQFSCMEYKIGDE